MEIYVYTIIFIMGTLFGSFYTLAVYRIPLHKDMTHEHSFCPNCNHKLGILDLIPILSYIFLGGKCRYCSQKIRIRYLLLEILSGIVFILLFSSMKIDLINIEISKFINFLFWVLIYSALVINAGIAKEKGNFQKSVTIFGIVTMVVYILYLCIVEKYNIYRYAIYLICVIISIIIYLILSVISKVKNVNKYFIINIINIFLIIVANYLI